MSFSHVAETMWLDAAANFNIQPSEFDQLPVWRMRQLIWQIEQLRKEQAK